MSSDHRSVREHIIAQAQYLIDEMDAVASQIAGVPDDILSLRPREGEHSVKEIFALIGLYDRHVYLPALRCIMKGVQPTLKERGDRGVLMERNWVNEPIQFILNYVKSARAELVSLLRTLPAEAWKRKVDVGSDVLTIPDVGISIIQHDSALLRQAAIRLYDSRRTP